jgi:hypothetical protein
MMTEDMKESLREAVGARFTYFPGDYNGAFQVRVPPENEMHWPLCCLTCGW